MIIFQILGLLLVIYIILTFIWVTFSPLVCVISIVAAIAIACMNQTDLSMPEHYKHQVSNEDMFVTKQAEHIKNVTFRK